MSNAGFPKVDLRTILSADSLPAMPQTAIRLLELSQQTSTGPAEFAVPIEADPGLTVQVLRFANSSYFGFCNEVSSIKHAITLLGIRTVRNFVLWSAIFSAIPNPRCGTFDLKGLWQDSLRRALFARGLARLLGLREADEAFAAALLQDMAVPILAKEVPEAYAQLFDARRRSQFRARLSQLETYAFGWNHASAGAMAARHWSLPPGLTALIEDHLSVEQHLAQRQTDPAKIAVAMSALLPSVDDSNWTEFERLEGYYQQMRPLDGPAIERLLEQIDEEYAGMAPLLRIPSPGVSLKQSYRQLTAASV